MKKIELLAPAGDLEKLKVAIIYGADAVFCGGKKFSLRARASNFEIADLKEAVDFANAHGSKIYVTCNILPHEDDLDGLEEYLTDLDRIGVHGIIAASPVIVETALRIRKQMEVHLSTQQTTQSTLGVKYWAEKGLERVVLGRENTLEEIREICANVDTEIEVFIHGGMCSSYSGRCTLSNNLTDRDANRGGCAHSCRWNYTLYKDGEKVDTEENKFFSFASKDLQAIRFIPDLIDAKVASLKIEGRMKSVHYIATIVNVYRKLIDEYLATGEIKDFSWYEEEIKKSENRLAGKGFFEGKPTKDEHLYDNRSEKPNKLFVGLVLDYNEETGMALVEQRNYFETNERLEVFSPNFQNKEFVVEYMTDEKHNEITVCRNPKDLVYIKLPFKVSKYDMLRRMD